MSLKVAFRVDASMFIGTGHVMRCLTLATELRLKGAHCFFICRELSGNLIDAIKAAGFLVHPIFFESSVSNYLGSNLNPNSFLESQWKEDSDIVLNILGEGVDWLVVDHYYLDERWEKKVLPGCKNLMVIDDLANRPHFCDLLLDQTLGRLPADYRGLISSKTQLFIGPSYALIRPIFRSLREQSIKFRKQKNHVDRLMISMGGVDLDNHTLKILEGLRGAPLPSSSDIKVVMGANAPWIDSVNRLALNMPWKTEILVNTPNMAELMAKSDLAIGAAGSTSWERCCLGLPTLICVLADNQRMVADKLIAAKSAKEFFLGAELKNNLYSLIEWISGGNNLSILSGHSLDVCDGEGVYRITEKIITCY
jgi:UDP-2,4-diacetamido-2,4,6-trideoxy-beta-L-altropyranose hydrolase